MPIIGIFQYRIPAQNVYFPGVAGFATLTVPGNTHEVTASNQQPADLLL